MILCVLLITIEFPSLCKLEGMTSRYLAAGAMCHASRPRLGEGREGTKTICSQADMPCIPQTCGFHQSQSTPWPSWRTQLSSLEKCHGETLFKISLSKKRCLLVEISFCHAFPGNCIDHFTNEHENFGRTVGTDGPFVIFVFMNGIAIPINSVSPAVMGGCNHIYFWQGPL